MTCRPTVTLYVPCYNGERYIAKCIEGILTQFRLPDEVFVIDDGSTDQTAAIAECYPQVTVIRHEKNSGLAAARNTAIKAAAGDLIASIDADCIADKLWLYTLIQLMKDMPDNLAGIGGKLVERFQEAPADEFRSIFMCQHKGEEPLANPKFIAGANTIFRRKALLSVGGYNEAFRTNGEDVNICRKLEYIGFNILYDPRAVVLHQRMDTVASAVRMNWAHWRYPMAITFPATTFWKAWTRAGQRMSYSALLVRYVVKKRKYRLLAIAFRCLLITPFWELREWWYIRRSNSVENCEEIAKKARQISLQPLENLSEFPSSYS